MKRELNQDRYGYPAEAMQAVLASDTPAAAPLMQAMTTAGIVRGTVRTITERLRKAGIGMPERTIRNALKHPIFRMPGAPRYNEQYTRPTTQSLLKRYKIDADKLHFDYTAPQHLTSAHKLRKCLLYGFIHRRPGQHAQAFLASLLGVTASAIRSYLKAMPVHSKEQWEHQRSIYQEGEPPDTPARGKYLRIYNAYTKTIRKVPFMKALVRQYQTGDPFESSLTVMKRQPNRYHILDIKYLTT